MGKKILINARHHEEKRVAIVEGEKLTDFYVETASAARVKGNIYKAVITALDKGLEAAFVDYGPDKHGFLPLREVMPENYRAKSKHKVPRISEVLAKGQELLVQVEQDPRGNKGAKLTNYISIPGRYLVMIPGRERVGISRKIEDQDARDRLKAAFKGLKLPKGMGFILRTAGAESTTEELAADLKYLSKLHSRIMRENKKAPAPSLLYKEADIAVRTVRDYLGSDVTEVLVDDLSTLRLVKNFLKLTMPWRSINVSQYKGKVPLFDEYGLEEQIARLADRQVDLHSGGSIVIDRTEALTAIDVNSARARGKDTEALALKTNMEAAVEIARQLRLRDIGGLIVIDFIDMESRRNYQSIEDALREALDLDKAHYDTTKISRFGLLEMSRERMRPALHDAGARQCSACGGSGHVSSPELQAVAALRRLDSISPEGIKDGLVICRLPVESANYLVNQLRESLAAIEKDKAIRISVLADPVLMPGEMIFDTEHPAPAADRKHPAPAADRKHPAPAADRKHPEAQEAQDKAAKPKKRPRRRKKKAAPAGVEKETGSAAGAEALPSTDVPSGADTAAGSEASSTRPSPSKKRRERRKRSAKKKTAAPSTGETAAQ